MADDSLVGGDILQCATRKLVLTTQFEVLRDPGRVLRTLALGTLLLSTQGHIIASIVPNVVAQPPVQPLRTITKAREAHDLTNEEARRHYPVRLRAVVTYFDPYIDKRHTAVFVRDESGGIFVALPSQPDPWTPAGTLVEIDGFTAPGDFAPIVDKVRIRKLDSPGLPASAPHVNLSQMLSGREDSQWVEMEGVIRSVRFFGRNVQFDLATSEGEVAATSVWEPDNNYEDLIDTSVKIHANVAPTFNRRLQMTGIHLLFPNLKQVRVVERAPDPFALKVLPIESLLRSNQNLAFEHRVHLRGAVTLDWPGRMLCIQGVRDGLCVQSAQMDAIAAGEVVDIVGFPVVGKLTPTLNNATFRPVGESVAVEAPEIQASQALQGDFDSRLVEMQGRLIGEDNGDSDQTFVLSSGNFVFTVVLPKSLAQRERAVWQQGSVLRVTGICSVETNTTAAVGTGFSVPVSFRLLLRSTGDVLVVERASWWTPAHLVPVLVIVLVAALAVLAWVALLRHRITAQAILIWNQNETLKSLSFQDGLTGVANRRKFDEILALEFERAIESSSPISLLMIDIDLFKALNDTYGHQHGDECLKKLAKALGTAVLRSSDLLARYGGEEFAVVMPRCEEIGAVATGERMRIAVRNQSIAHSGSPFEQRVSISVGVASLTPCRGDSPSSLIALADQALYESKKSGRNRTTFATALRDRFLMPTAKGLA